MFFLSFKKFFFSSQGQKLDTRNDIRQAVLQILLCRSRNDPNIGNESNNDDNLNTIEKKSAKTC